MRRLFSFNMMSLDGFFEGPGHDLEWHNTDAEFNDFAIDQLNEIGMILFGRVTYEMMASFWPSPTALESDPEVAGLMNRTAKVVFSRTMDKAAWENTRLIKEGVAEEITRLKQQPGKDIAVFGSADLLSSLVQMDLVDEHRVMVNPVILGNGTPLFKRSEDRIGLRMVRHRTFANGNVLLCYEPKR